MTMHTHLPSAFPWSRSQGGWTDPFIALQQEVNRIFDNFGNVPMQTGNFAEFGRTISPRIDVSETDKQLEIEAELPGLSEKDIDVTVSGDILTLRGEARRESEEKKRNYFLSERSYGAFFRTINLPFEVDPEMVTAHFDKGILRIIVKKPESASARTSKVPVRASA
ncbi:MAG: Hsp20/alpha crystallin family protein [Alphaproteobacteria bacterium]